MRATRKKLLIDKYIALTKELEKYNDKSIQPVLGDDIDLTM